MGAVNNFHEQDIDASGSNLQWRIIRRLAFGFDAERMHTAAISWLKLRSNFAHELSPCSLARHPSFKQNLAGLEFANPVGLAAGFDVDGECLPALQAMGFGFLEVGGITEHAQPGNAKPRIFRLPREQALINRLNFYNKGVDHLRANLCRYREKNLLQVPVGVNLGKSNFSKLDELPQEYLRSFKKIADCADYVTLNVSCPNTVGLSRYQNASDLEALLTAICNYNAKLERPLPLFIKLGPDLNHDAALTTANLALNFGLAGLVISNTSSLRHGLPSYVNNFGPGGLSGKPIFAKSTEFLRLIAKDYSDKLILIGSGGIMNGLNAVNKLEAGAKLLQVYTGFIYGGPNFVFAILKSLMNQQAKPHCLNASRM